jgi:hypothetical protein
VLAPGASYPPIRITVSVGSNAPATLTNAPTVAGGGDGTTAAASDAIPVQADAYPNGWPAETRVLGSDVMNPERADRCTLLDAIWDAEPVAGHAAFVAHVDAAAAAITFRQHIGATDALRTGSYSTTLTFTLSTATP